MTSFKPMLAASEIPTPEQLKFPLLASFKLDGIRSPIFGGVAMSRKFLPLPNKHFQRVVAQNSTMLEGIDCEVISGSPTGKGVFHRTQSAIMSWEGTPDFKIYVFDAFAVGSQMPAQVRYDALRSWHQHLPEELQSWIVLVEQRLVQSIAELKAYMALAMELGYEGLILKNPHANYKYGRSTLMEGTLLKWKEFADAEGRIMFVHEGKTNNNVAVKDALGNTKRSTNKANMTPNGSCGGFRVYCQEIADKYGEDCAVFDVGPGVLTKELSYEMYANREALIGKHLTFKYQPYGMLGMPRFPQFKGLRDELDIGQPT